MVEIKDVYGNVILELVADSLLGADLLGADLRGANLQVANLRGADLRGANLLVADLRGAYLRVANLRGAYLRGADLRGADLPEKELIIITLRRWNAYCIGGYIRIGCQYHSREKWAAFTDAEIAEMDDDALEYWSKYRDLILLASELK